jgi:hypothetical protein
VTLQQLGEVRLVDGTGPGRQSGILHGIVVHQNDVVAQFRQASPGHQTNIS